MVEGEACELEGLVVLQLLAHILQSIRDYFPNSRENVYHDLYVCDA